ncbi:MAG: flagellar hook-basal body complex protein [Bradyrhizobiaceae bacterium]|nr:flagellar hook-basal body complex protein [Bradyrhizobiaceae bacterium]
MGLFGAMTTAVAGLRAQAFALENVSGNIANSQTTGFKRVDTSFADLVPDSVPQLQLAGGVIARSRGTNNVQGDIQNSSVNTFMAINGDGYFIVQKPSGFPDGTPVFEGVDLFSRRGDFQLDKDGYLVNGSGYYLKVLQVDGATGNVIGSVPEVLQFSNDFLPAQPTTLVEYRANLASYPRTGRADADTPGSERLDPTSFSFNPTIAGTGTVVANDVPIFVEQSIAGGAITVYDSVGSPINIQLRWAKLPNDAAVATGSADLNPAVNLSAFDTETVTITVDGVNTVLTLNTTTLSDSTELIAAIDAIAGISASLNGSDQIEITGDNPNTNFTITYSDPAIGTAIGLSGATFQSTDTRTWEMFYLEDANAVGTNVAWRNAGVNYTFDASGQMTSPTQTVDLTGVTINGIPLGNITISHGATGITQFADVNGTVQVNLLRQNGYPAGELQTISVNEKGRIIATYSNGRTLEMAEIVLASFNADNSLKRLDGGAFEATSESGPAQYGASGKILGKALEGSNTDIADEFTKLIVTQQAYAANTRIVTTSDRMLQETLNLVR